MPLASRASMLALLFVECFAAKYSQFVFVPKRLRGDAAGAMTQNMVQLAEFELFSKGTLVDLRQAQASSPSQNAAPESGASAVDQDLSTKWLDMGCPVDPTPFNRTACALTVVPTAPVEADSFTFVTAKDGDPSDPNDDELKRDPVEFTLLGTDGTGAVVVLYDSQSDYATPTARNKELPKFAFSPSGGGGGGGGGGSDDGGCGGGCAFLIIFFVGGFTYFAAGVALNRFRNGKEGVEMIPHLEFWKDFPILVKDGFVFASSKVRGQSASYSAV